MEGVEVENGSASARPEADAATAAKEAAKQVVAAMSRRVRGIDKATGTVAGVKDEKPADAAPVAMVPGFVTSNAKAGFVIHVQKLNKMVTEVWAVNELIAIGKGNLDGDTGQICVTRVACA